MIWSFLSLYKYFLIFPLFKQYFFSNAYVFRIHFLGNLYIKPLFTEYQGVVNDWFLTLVMLAKFFINKFYSHNSIQQFKTYNIVKKNKKLFWIHGSLHKKLSFPLRTSSVIVLLEILMSFWNLSVSPTYRWSIF